MLIGDVIYNSLFESKLYSTYLLDRILDRQTWGENVEKEWTKFVVLGEWIRILETYYNTLEDGNLPATDDCLTYSQISTLMASLKELRGNVKLEPSSDWFLQTGFFNDNGFYRDNAVWQDTVVIS